MKDNSISIREVLRVAAPLIVSMGSYTIMQFCDRIFLAWHSGVSIQAALPGGILAFSLMCIFSELAGYSNSFVAQYHGAGDRNGCSRAAAQGIMMALLSWPLIILLIPAGWWVISMSGHPPEVAEAESGYLTILMLGGVVQPLNAAIASFFTGRGRSGTTMFAGICANVVNVFLAYGLVFGRFGLPAMGMNGAAIASVTAGLVSPAILLAIFFSGKVNAEFESRRNFKFDRVLFLRMIRFGLKSAASVVLDVASFTLFVMFTGRLSGAAFAGSNIALSINNLAFLPLIGFHIAAASLVGKYQGAKRPDMAEAAGWVVLKVAFAYMFVIALTFVLLPTQYFSLFTKQGGQSFPLEEILPAGRWLLVMMALWGMFDTVNLVLAGALKGAGDTKFVMLWSVLLAWGIWVPGELVIVFMFKGGIIMMWLWLMIYIMFLSTGLFIRYRRGRWKSIELIEPTAAADPLQQNTGATAGAS